MALRVLIYSQLIAIAVTGLIVRWDHTGVPIGPGEYLYLLGIWSLWLVPFFPIALLAVLVFSSAGVWQKVRGAVVSVAASIAHFIAAMPMIQ